MFGAHSDSYLLHLQQCTTLDILNAFADYENAICGHATIATEHTSAALRALACQHLMCVAFEPGGRVVGVEGGPAHQVDYEIALQYAVTQAAVWNPV